MYFRYQIRELSRFQLEKQHFLIIRAPYQRQIAYLARFLSDFDCFLVEKILSLFLKLFVKYSNVQNFLICHFRDFESNKGSLLRVWLSKFEAPETIFMAIFELSMIENPSKHRTRIEFRNSRIFEKYYVRVLNSGQIWFSQKSIGFQIVKDMN